MARTEARAILFDADGVLVDSHAGYRNVWTRWSEMHGLDPHKVIRATHARRPTDTISEVAPHLHADNEYDLLIGFVNELPDRIAELGYRTPVEVEAAYYAGLESAQPALAGQGNR